MKTTVLKFAGILGLVLATTGGFALAKDDTTKVNVALWDAGEDMTMVDTMRIADHPDLSKAPMGIKSDKMTFNAGEVTFNVTNNSKDIEHEMVVARISDLNKGLAYEPSNGAVDEEQNGMNIGEVPELAPGKSGSLTLHLKAGKYALYCNVPGHYASGMWTIITVKGNIEQNS